MTDQEFGSWYARIMATVSEYETTDQRMAVIAGFFNGMNPETTLTAAQIAEILKLRNKNEHSYEAATSGCSTNNTQ